MSDQATARGNLGFEVTVEKALLVAVPTIAVVGGSFWFGYINVAGRDYLWLLTVQDLLMVSLLLVPLYGFMLLAMYAFGGWEEPVVQTERGPQPLLVDFARMGGTEWNPRAERWIGYANKIVIGLTLLCAGAVLLDPRGWVGGYVFPLVGIPATYVQMYSAYRQVRFGDGRLLLIGSWSGLFLLSTAATGSSLALSAEDRSAKSILLTFDGGEHLSVSGLQKLGEHFIFYDQRSRAWWVRNVDDVKSLTQETKVATETDNRSPATIPPTPAPEQQTVQD